MSNSVVGIDLGTSFSSVACLDHQGRPNVLKNAEGETMTPSAVYFGPEGVLVGTPALQAGREEPDRLVEHPKRYLGEKSAWEIGGVSYSPVDVSAFILRKLRKDAEHHIGPLGPVVLTVPVHFTVRQRQLACEAARQAGLEVLDLVNEPVAAALAYIMGDQGLAYSGLAELQTILVYDLGGGTFDLSLVRYSDERVQVLASGGDLLLGGLDWDQQLIDEIARRFERKHGVDLRRNTRHMRMLIDVAESAKRALSDTARPGTNVTIRGTAGEETFAMTRAEFEELTVELVARTAGLTEGLLKSAGLHWHRVDQVLPVGGSTRMPMIRHLLDSMCNKFLPHGRRPNYSLSPDLAIVQGAALHAGLRTTAGMERLIPTGRCPHGLGLAVRNDEGRLVNHVLIPRNAELPASVAVVVATHRPGQPRISLKIVEGDAPEYGDDAVLMRCVLNDLPDDLPSDSPFDVELTYEPSGLLSVVAKHRHSGRLATTSIVHNA